MNAIRERRVEPFYVTDEIEVYTENWRLKELSVQMKTEFLIVQHVFGYETMKQKSRSFLTPTGHPWAALCLFDSVLVALAKGHREVHLGNERSADEGNHIFFGGVEINHQYDKSSSFLSAATEYIHRYICPSSSLIVLSPLRNLWDIQVAELFCTASELRPFLPLFLSCNEPLPGLRWCMDCDKCFFVYLLLSAFLSPTTVHAIFGTDLFCISNEEEDGEQICESQVDMEKKEMWGETTEKRVKRFYGVLGYDANGIKPFECIGTANESRAALQLALRQRILYISEGREKEPDGDVLIECIPWLLKKLSRKCGVDFDETLELSRDREDERVTRIVLEKWLSKEG